MQELLSQLKDLNELFKKIQLLTVEQGSVLDRIDKNINIGRETAEVATHQIERSLKIETS